MSRRATDCSHSHTVIVLKFWVKYWQRYLCEGRHWSVLEMQQRLSSSMRLMTKIHLAFHGTLSFELTRPLLRKWWYLSELTIGKQWLTSWLRQVAWLPSSPPPPPPWLVWHRSRLPTGHQITTYWLVPSVKWLWRRHINLQNIFLQFWLQISYCIAYPLVNLLDSTCLLASSFHNNNKDPLTTYQPSSAVQCGVLMTERVMRRGFVVRTSHYIIITIIIIMQLIISYYNIITDWISSSNVSVQIISTDHQRIRADWWVEAGLQSYLISEDKR